MFEKVRRRLAILALAGGGIFGVSGAAHAVVFAGVDFPDGAVSFADEIVDYSPGAPAPNAANSNPDNALGPPTVFPPDSVNACVGDPTACPFVSLGKGGSLAIRFTDNLLTGSDNADLDLWIFEVGPDVEDMFVEISTDGVAWVDVGKVGGSTAGVDIDAFGFTAADTFAYVRVRDDPDLDGMSGASVGADIDAIGAISTVVVPVPEPASLLLAAVGLLLLAGLTRRHQYPDLT